MFKNRFDYTNLLIRINAIDGQELSLAETLNKLAPIYNYSFQDHTTEYLKQEDNQRTIRLTVYGAALFIGLMNAGILIYMHLLIFIRRSKQLLILRIIGHSDHSLMAFLALTELPGCFAGSVNRGCGRGESRRPADCGNGRPLLRGEHRAAS